MNIDVEQELDLPVDRVWGVLSNFGDLSWNSPMVQHVSVEGEGIGMLRYVQMAGAPEPLVQCLETMDHDQHTFSFRLVKGMQVDLANFRTWVHLEGLPADRCRIQAKLHFDEPRGTEVEELRFLFEDSVRGSIGRLRHYLERQTVSTG